MNNGKSSINSMGRIITLISLILMSNLGIAQIWSEDFNVGLCANTNNADTTTTSNGNYIVSFLQTTDTTSHAWYISSRETFLSLGSCGASCSTTTSINRTLHLSKTAGTGDLRANYNPDSAFSTIVYTPQVNVNGFNDLMIEFDYLLGGDTSDKAYFVVNIDTATLPPFSLELNSTISTSCPLGTWVHKVVYLPAAYNNQLGLYFGFRFDSDGNSSGSGVSLAVDNISIFNSVPLTDFTQSATTICDGNSVIFLDSTSGNPTSYSWDFGTSASQPTATGPGPHIVSFTGTGPKTVSLTTTNSNGSSSESKTVTVINCQPPTPAIASSDSNLCQGQCISFQNMSTDGSFGQGEWTWQFQGGTPNISTDENPANICYTNTGLYNVTLTVVDTVSNEDSTIIFTDFIEVGTCAVPTATFGSDTTEICNNDFIEFYSTSTGIPDSIIWYFEGGNPTFVADSHLLADTVQIYYPTPGTYDVAIWVKNSGGIVVDTLFDYVTVNDCPTPVPDFAVSDASPCPGVPIVFEDNSQFATEWFWEFPGANPSTATTSTVVNVIYDEPGIYPVTLTVKNVNGEATLIEEGFIEVDSCLGPKPQWIVERDSICRGTCVEFFNTSLRADSIIWIFWLHPDSTLAGDTIDSLTPGYEWIREDFPLVRKDTFFDKGVDYYPMVAPMINDTSPLFCFNDSMVIGVSMIAYNEYAVVAEHQPDIAVLAVGGTRPTVNAGPDQLIRIDNITSRFYLDDTVNLEGMGTGKYVAWYPEEGLSCYNCPRPVVYPTETRKYYLTAYDDYGCQAFDSVSVYIENSFYAGIPNVFSPNGDDNNDVLWVRGNAIAEEGFVMRIWDRYGNIIFESYSQNDGWDGTIDGTDAPIGGYTYYVKLTFIDGRSETLSGNVMLVRN
jgi:gliding motility-associated-like protein